LDLIIQGNAKQSQPGVGIVLLLKTLNSIE
jgi:hypothetical protein